MLLRPSGNRLAARFNPKLVEWGMIPARLSSRDLPTETRGAEGAGEADDAETGAVALLGMGPALEDLLAERRRRRADLPGVVPDALDRPAGVSPMAGGHVFGNGGGLPVPAPAQMNGDALALVENLDATGGHPRLDLGAGETVGDGIIVGVDLDVIVDADPGQRHSLYS